jgi:hypothetical protein
MSAHEAMSTQETEKMNAKLTRIVEIKGQLAKKGIKEDEIPQYMRSAELVKSVTDDHFVRIIENGHPGYIPHVGPFRVDVIKVMKERENLLKTMQRAMSTKNDAQDEMKNLTRMYAKTGTTLKGEIVNHNNWDHHYQVMEQRVVTACFDIGNAKNELIKLAKTDLVDTRRFYEELYPLLDELTELYNDNLEIQMKALESRKKQRTASGAQPSAFVFNAPPAFVFTPHPPAFASGSALGSSGGSEALAVLRAAALAPK